MDEDINKNYFPRDFKAAGKIRQLLSAFMSHPSIRLMLKMMVITNSWLTAFLQVILPLKHKTQILKS